MKKSFIKVTNKGSVVRVVREHYLRDDIPCGVNGCPLCREALEGMPSSAILLEPGPMDNPIFKDKKILLCPDTNLLLHFLDVFESPKIHDCIILQTVLEEVRKNNTGLYNRVRSLVTVPSKRFFVFSNEFHRQTHVEKGREESDNDRNDRAIRAACKWYREHQSNSINVILLTNDKGNREKAHKEGLTCLDLFEFVRGFDDPGLLDAVERSRRDDEVSQSDDKDLRYSEHVPLSRLHAGIKAGQLYQGTLQCSSYNAFEGHITVTGPGDSTSIIIAISGRQCMNRAMNGDSVVVELLPRDEWGKIADGNEAIDPELDDSPIAPAEEDTVPSSLVDASQPKGKVVGIVRRSGRSFCGSIDRRSIKPNAPIQNILFISMDRRIPRVRIRTRQAGHLAGQRVVVAVDEWPVNSRYPLGHLVRQLGIAGDRSTETEAILLEHDVAHADFTPAVLACLPTPDWRPLAEDHVKRADFRDLCICSVDPPGCTDIDDALHARPIPGSDNYEVGVHIADVTHFVQYGTALDKEAASRATTVYLVDRRIDMLPGLLGTNLCSLQSGVERLAFSVIWEMTRNADVVRVRFTKSVISSKASLTYDQAQARLDDPHDSSEITRSLKLLNGLAATLKERRIAAGALTLASPEVRFSIDRETMNPVDVELNEMKAANSMVEEFMLLANIHVAQELYKAFPDTALLRRHPAPPVENFTSLNAALVGLNQLPLDVSSSHALADSLDRITTPSDPFLNKLIRIMTTRCMQQAVYFASGTQPYDQFWHYGLACPIYTHFTSPIRRYADVIVHRLLAACIDWSSPSSIAWSKQELDELSHNLNYRNRMAQQAQRSSVELFTHMYFKEKTAKEEAYIIKVMQNGFVVLLPNYGIEGVIHCDSLEWHFDPQKSRFLDDKDEPVVYLFKRVMVQAVVEENEATGRPKLKFTLLDAPLSPDRCKEKAQ